MRELGVRAADRIKKAAPKSGLSSACRKVLLCRCQIGDDVGTVFDFGKPGKAHLGASHIGLGIGQESFQMFRGPWVRNRLHAVGIAKAFDAATGAKMSRNAPISATGSSLSRAP